MFGFGKISKPALANKLIALSVEASEQFHNYLKEDSFLYGKCINENPIKNTSAIFVLNLYRDMLNSKYDGNDVLLSFAPLSFLWEQIKPRRTYYGKPLWNI